MAYLIENQLKKLSDENPELSILLSQWTFDKKLISKALQNVNVLFQHFSSHDASHSNQIVTQIENLLGEENIKKLSATDCWFLLEASYLHDIGMVVPRSELNRIWNDEKFELFFKGILNDREHELYNYAIILNQYSERLLNDGKIWHLKVYDAIIFVYSEFFRKIHSKQSKKIVLDPEIIALKTPRSGLFPQRYFDTLSEICNCHGEDFDYVMNLPHRMNGLSNEHSHPRFIAFMLRIGDLLDLDNERFCPTLISILGDLPKTSQDHYNKHASIKHFRVDNEKIEVTSICKDEDSYSITSQWFGWIEEEITKQTNNWYEIAPNKDFGFLPRLGKIEIKIEGEETLDSGSFPKFEMDVNKSIELLQGSGIYDSKYIFIREAFQNSLDATFLNIWHELKSKNPLFGDLLNKEISDLEPNDFINIFKYFPISFEIKQLQIDKNKITWEINIIDKGIGFTKDDIKYLKTIGKSSKKFDKTNLISSMPEWMKPSGIFGIGIHSYFLITDEILITTKSKLTNESLEINLYDPKIKKTGNILIKKPVKDLDFYGTKVTLKLNLDLIPPNINFKNDDFSYSDLTIQSFDPITDTSLNSEISYIIDEISYLSLCNPFPIEIRFNNELKLFESNINNDSIFDPKNNIQVDILGFNLLEGYFYYPTYRNIEIERIGSFNYRFNYCSVSFNLLYGKSDDILTLNRKKIKDHLLADVYNKCRKSLANIIPSYYQEIKDNKKENFNFDEKALSLFIKQYYSDNEKEFILLKKSLPENLINAWKDIDLGKGFKLFNILETSKKVQLVFLSQEDKNIEKFSDIFEVEDKEDLILVKMYRSNNIFDSIRFLFDKSLYLIDMEKSGDYFSYTYSKENLLPNNSIISLFKDQIRSRPRLSRVSIPCINGYEELEIDDLNTKLHYSEVILPFFKRRMLFPFILSKKNRNEFNCLADQNLDRLADWTLSNSTKKDLKKTEVIRLYKEFIQYYESINSNPEVV